MTDAPRPLPEGMTPRLLTSRQAAAYCGVAEERFEQTVTFAPIRVFGTRKLWDRRALDRWLDGISGINTLSPKRPIEERLNDGNPRARD